MLGSTFLEFASVFSFVFFVLSVFVVVFSFAVFFVFFFAVFVFSVFPFVFPPLPLLTRRKREIRSL
jgi:hypothetical protein